MEIVTENAVTLAWLGDALMNTYIREHLLKKGYTRVDDLQKKSTQYLSAKAQSRMLRQLEEEGFFLEDEAVILQRGKAVRIHTKAKNADVREYLQATALEALLGYLHLYHHPDRLKMLLTRLAQIGDESL